MDQSPRNQLLSAIKPAAGNAHWSLLHCYHCHDTPACGYQPDQQCHWAIKLRCKCGRWWRVCTTCEAGSQRSHFHRPDQASRHNRTKHKVPPNAANRAPDSSTHTNQPTSSSKPSHLTNPTRCGRKASTTFFEAARNGDAAAHLVSNAVFKTPIFATSLNKDDVTMFLAIAHFVATLSRTQRDHLCVTLQRTIKALVEQANAQFIVLKRGPEKETPRVPVPVRRQFVRTSICQGKHSIYANLPHPSVQTVAEHSCTLPSECVADFLGHGGLSSVKQQQPRHRDYESLPESEFAKQIAPGATKALIASIWSDDFEPNYSKHNRGSTWIATMTTQHADSGPVTVRQVYPVAVGPKGANHSAPLDIILADLQSMGVAQQMYDGASGVMRSVQTKLACVVQDQPERRGANSLLCGGIGFHSRFGWCLDTGTNKDILPACRRCFYCMVNHPHNQEWQPRVDCPDCSNWMANNMELPTKVPEHFPPGEPIPQRLRSACKLDVALLSAAAARCHEMVAANSWGKKESAAYLSLHCFNIESRNQIHECAANCAVKRRVEASGDTARIESVRAMVEDDPSKWMPWQLPAFWRNNVTLEQFSEPGMHLLFLGIVKNDVFEYQHWATCQKKGTSLRSGLQSMTTLVERLHLSWCKMQPYKGDKLGGWYSENFVAMARVLPWAYSWVSSLSPDDTTTSDIPISSWSKEQCKDYLKRRRLKATGKLPQLRRRVRENKNTPIPPPSGGDARNITRMVISQWTMISHLMGCREGSPVQVSTAERLIRVYLTCNFVLDHHLRKDGRRSQPRWISQCNNMSLLNMPSQMKLFGPVRNRWEGGVRGEGFLRLVKPTIQPGRLNWQRNLMTNLLRQKSLLHLKDSEDLYEEIAMGGYAEAEDEYEEQCEEEADEEETDTPDLACYKLHSSAADLISKLSTGDTALSVILTCGVGGTFRMYGAYKRSGEQLLQEIRTRGESRLWWGMHYYQMQIGATDSSPDLPSLDGHPVHSISRPGYAMLLPIKLPPQMAPASPMYAAVTDSWETLSGQGRLCMPLQYMAVSMNVSEEDSFP